jgi:hypothetical protein
MTTQRRKRLTFLPYDYAPLALRLNVEVERGVTSIDETNLALTVDDLDASEELHLRLAVTVTAEAIAKALIEARAKLVVTARCRATRWRRAVQLEAVDDGEWRAPLTLRRRDLRDDVHLEPAAVAITELDSGAQTGQRIGAGRPWTLRIDPKPMRASAHLQVLFRSFSESADIPAPSDVLYWLEADAEEPVLWLNEDHRSAIVALKAEGTRGAAARIREVAFDAIAAAVWKQLFIHAIEGHSELGEAAYPWQTSVVETLGEHLFPDVAAA